MKILVYGDNIDVLRNWVRNLGCKEITEIDNKIRGFPYIYIKKIDDISDLENTKIMFDEVLFIGS